MRTRTWHDPSASSWLQLAVRLGILLLLLSPGLAAASCEGEPEVGTRTLTGVRGALWQSPQADDRRAYLDRQG